MNNTDVVVMVIIAAAFIAVAPKVTAFKGLKWKRGMERTSRTSKAEEL